MYLKVTLWLIFVAAGLSIAAPRLLARQVGDVHSPKCFVVCPTKFRESIKPWIAYREGRGCTVRIVDSAGSALAVKQRLLDAGLDGDTDAVLLVGDCRITAADTAEMSVEVPTFYRKAGPTSNFGTTETLAGDAPYGDLDGDGVPEVAVGRLPVDTPEQLAGLIRRIEAYESSDNFETWRDRVQITAGVGGFGVLADAAIESATRSMLTSSVPNSTRICVTYCSPTSPFNPGPNDFFPAVLRRYRQGGRFWVYLGHGQITELDRVPGPGGSYRPVLSCADLDLLEQPAESAPIAVMLACYSGAYDATVDSLAERMLNSEGGPIAVLAGSRVTMPYGNAVAGQGLIHAVYEGRAERLGAAWLAAQRELATDASTNAAVAERRQLIDALAAAVSPNAELLPEERLEHVHLYNLLGDPMLRLQHPGTIELDVVRGVAPGSEFEIHGVAPHAGDLCFTVCYPPGNARVDQTSTRAEQYEQANRGEIASIRVTDQPAGNFKASLVMPKEVRGPVYIIARLHNDTQWSVGSQRLLVRPQ